MHMRSSLKDKLCIVVIATVIISKAFASQTQQMSMDNFSRLVSYPGKIETICPKQSNKTAVFLVIGQSNAANAAEKKFATKYPGKVFNYFLGKCYIASSPLLGAGGIEGEFITPLADQLIDNGDYESVVIINSSIGATAINRWEEGGDLNAMLLSVLAELKPKFKITEIIWHQGETDFFEKTPPKKYSKSFHSLLQSIRKVLNDAPPLYYAIATKCGVDPKWSAENPIAKEQKVLADEALKIYLGANTDELLENADRRSDQCHFSEQGQLKTAASFAKAIHQHKL